MLIVFTELLILFLLILLNGVFAMAEIALVSARKSRLESLAEQGKRSARIALRLAKAPNRFLATVQIGITLVGILAGAIGGATLAEAIAMGIQQVPILAPYSQVISLLIVVLAITYLTLIFGELVPKRLALNNPEKISMRIAPGMQLLSRLAAPLSKLLSISTDFVLRMVGGFTPNDPPVTEEDIKALVRHGAQTGVVAEIEQQMVSGVFRLGDRRVDELSTPRTEIEWLDLDEPLTEMRQVALSSPHSVFPVARGSLDNILGIISAKDLLARMTTEPEDPLLESELEQPLYIPGSTPALKLLQTLRQDKPQMAMVIDEFGGLSGLITPQNILDAIYGDTFQAEETRGNASNETNWLLNGLTPIDQLEEILPIQNLPPYAGRHYKTLGGMISTHLGRIPKPGERITYNGLSFEVIEMDHHRVDKVRITRSGDNIPFQTN
jgi:putative hemolysin